MLNLTDKRVQDAVRAYTDKHGGSFFYEEPGNAVLYEDGHGACLSLNSDISDEAFIALLKSGCLRLISVKDTGGVKH